MGRKISKTFYDWCVENDRSDLLNRWDYELNKYNPKEISYSSSNQYYFKCPNKKHASELNNMASITVNNKLTKCKQCNSFAQWGIDNICSDFLDKYWDYEKNKEINPWKINHGWNNKIWIKCQLKNYHGSYFISCNHFIKGERCSFCCNHHGVVHKFDSLGCLYSDVINVWSDRNNKSIYEYSSHSTNNAYWKCPNNKHEDFLRNIDRSVTLDFRCPECSKHFIESLLQEKVRKHLEENYESYIINHEYNCTIVPINPKINNGRGRLPFDNEVQELKLIIESHGKQHYELTPFAMFSSEKKCISPEEEFRYQRLKDRYKRMYAKNQGYYYLEIPYWTEKDKSYKQLIDNKINEILINKLRA